MRIVDLTLPINHNMAPLPNVPQYQDNPTRCVVLTTFGEDHLAGLRDRGIETAPGIETAHHMTSRLEILTHIGTHIDAPLHFVEGAWSIDEVPLERIVKKGRIIPLTHLEPCAAVTADDILATGVAFDESVIPILHTGWTARNWGTEAFWRDTIYMDTSVSELVVDRGATAVGIDFFPEIPFWRMPLDPDKPRGPNHRRLLANGTIIIQMLTNIADIGSGDFTLVAVPLRLEGLDGSPARVFAMVDQ